MIISLCTWALVSSAGEDFLGPETDSDTLQNVIDNKLSPNFSCVSEK